MTGHPRTPVGHIDKDTRISLLHFRRIWLETGDYAAPRGGTSPAAAGPALRADGGGKQGHFPGRVAARGTATDRPAGAGDPRARETLVLVAHHDSAHTGLLFHPGLVPLVNRIAPGWYER